MNIICRANVWFIDGRCLFTLCSLHVFGETSGEHHLELCVLAWSGCLHLSAVHHLSHSSWTEDTRSCIFSESALRQSRENQEPLVEVLDRQIEQKFEEFDQLAMAGKKLFDDEHHLNKMVYKLSLISASVALLNWYTNSTHFVTLHSLEVSYERTTSSFLWMTKLKCFFCCFFSLLFVLCRSARGWRSWGACWDGSWSTGGLRRISCWADRRLKKLRQTLFTPRLRSAARKHR